MGGVGGWWEGPRAHSEWEPPQGPTASGVGGGGWEGWGVGGVGEGGGRRGVGGPKGPQRGGGHPKGPQRVGASGVGGVGG